MTFIDDSETSTAAVGITAATMDLTGRHYQLIAIGHDPRTTARLDHWRRALESAGRSATVHTLTDSSDVENIMEAGTVGDRFLVAGPELEVMEAVALARAAGILPCELLVHVVHTDLISVFCAHCESSTRSVVEPGATIECSGCARRVVVRPHTSSHRATYLASVG